MVVNKRSHNLLADHILKTVGRVVEGDGSFDGGGRAVTRFMEDSVRVVPAQLAIYDGSGLSTLNRVSAADFVSLLSYMAGHGDWNTLWETLPEAGNPRELGAQYAELKRRLLPRLNVVGGCCGTDHRHVEHIASACAPLFS